MKLTLLETRCGQTMDDAKKNIDHLRLNSASSIPSMPHLWPQYYVGRDARKPVFGVSDIARLKPAYLHVATETS